MNSYVVIDEKGQQSELSDLLRLSKMSVWRKIFKSEAENKSTSKPNKNLMGLMERMGWASHEPASDKGHFRFFPTGAMIFGLVSDWLEEIASNDFEASQIVTPFLYDWSDAATQNYAGKFDGNIYHVKSLNHPEDFALKFNGDIGAFRMMADACLEQRQLPVRIFELLRGFRYTQSGQVSGIWLGRTFMLLDLKSFCATTEESLDECSSLHQKAHDFLEAVGHGSYSVFTVTEDFYKQAERIITHAAQVNGRPVVVKIIPKQTLFWSMKHTIYTPHPEEIVQIQLDLENAVRYGITYKDESGTKKYGPIIHNALGSVERWMSIFLRDALNKQVPQLPLWLSPIQLRIIPIDEKHLGHSVALARTLREQGIRVDVDDRMLTLNKRVKLAEKLWIPYIVVFGDKEIQTRQLPVRIRGDNKIVTNVSEMVTMISSSTKGKPFRQLPTVLVSKCPTFSLNTE